MTPGRRRLVLVVEDSPADQEIIRRAFLSADEICDLVMVLDGESAMSFLHQRGNTDDSVRSDERLPDLVLLDLNLPNLSGREVLQRVRANPLLKHIPVLVLTTTQSASEVLECYRLGANCFITKPAAFQDFVSLIRGTCGFWFGLARLPAAPPRDPPPQPRPASLG
jgi:CheY-like chemotaxis protein